MTRWIITTSLLALGCGGALPSDEDDPRCEEVFGNASVRVFVDPNPAQPLLDAEVRASVDPFDRPGMFYSGDIYSGEWTDTGNWARFDVTSGTRVRFNLSARRGTMTDAGNPSVETRTITFDRACNLWITIEPDLSFSFAWRKP